MHKAGRHISRRLIVGKIAFWPLLVVTTLATASAYGQTKPAEGRSASPPGAAVYFIDLKDGATIPPKTVIHFGLRGMGVAPAGSDRENAGHHHLLIDTELPPLEESIPADFNHLHFGAGQTEAELNLPPGPHTLQLLLGGKDHVPHSPPVMSERIRVIVAEPHEQHNATAGPNQRHPSPPGAKVYFIYPTNGAYISRTPRIRFGLTNMGVAPAGLERANSGHHHLLIDTPLPPTDEPIPNDPNHLHFGAGQTEAQVTLALGVHTLQLVLGDNNHVPHDPPVLSKPIRVTVTESGRRPPPRRKSRHRIR
jgi:hypothetical protein